MSESKLKSSSFGRFELLEMGRIRIATEWWSTIGGGAGDVPSPAGGEKMSFFSSRNGSCNVLVDSGTGQFVRARGPFFQLHRPFCSENSLKSSGVGCFL